ncbi:hypothetical protein CAEBREN_21248 [Caenorhabditis brenneri]|uniref:Homeobox domain-containing protein n=1 Tax=Caenorhabditis brenneri TaxID=135651 RepID=G0PBE6_CAEBE|nr:hypothetical protein CAEBREN_21248 [Caenorhabditis brenneri]
MTRAQKYSCDLRAELLKEFEAGKGRISEEGKQKIQEKYGLNGRKITCWASDRRKRHGLYDEKKFCKKLWKFVKDHPNCPPSTELQEEFQKVFTNFVKIEGIGNTEGPIPDSENGTEN